MKLRLVAALIAATSPAAAQGYDNRYHVRVLTGAGGTLEGNPQAFGVMTAEIGHRPFGGALSTGVAFSSALEVNGVWSLVTPSLFARFDLTYVVASKMWEQRPRGWWLHVIVGFRGGVDVSESFRTKIETPEQSYVLIRPVAQPSAELELPLPRTPIAVNGRFAVDTSPGFQQWWRYSVSVGITYGWGEN